MDTIVITKFPEIEREGFDLKKYYRSFLTSSIVISASSRNVHYPINIGGPLSIKYVFKGEEYYTQYNCKFRVKSDSFIIFNELQKYGSYIESDELTESFSVFFQPDYVREVLSSLITEEDKILENPFSLKKAAQPVNFIEKLYPRDNYIIPLLTNLKTAIADNNYSEQYLKEQLYFLLEGLIYLNRELYAEIGKVSSVKRSTRVEVYRRLNTAKDYIDSCFSEKITLSMLARASGMSEHHLLREFKKFYKYTPYQYLAETRLEAAKKLLKETSYSISEVSRLSGFEYLSSFSEAFCKRFGISPTSFRRSA